MDAEVGFEPTSLGYEPSKATTPPLRNIIMILGNQPHISFTGSTFALPSRLRRLFYLLI